MIATRLTRTRRAASTVRSIAAVVAVVTGLAACGSSNAAVEHFSGPVYEVETAQVSGLGSVLVDGQGFTLYLYEPDAQSGHSRCSGPCAVEWSPLTLTSGVKSPIAGPGVQGLAALHDPSLRRNCPGDLRQMAALHMGAGHGARSGDRRRPRQPRRCLVRARRVRQPDRAATRLSPSVQRPNRAASSDPPVVSPALYEWAPAPASLPASTIRYSSRIGLLSKKHSRISRVPAAYLA